MCDERPATNRVTLVATCNPALPDLRKIVKDHQAILNTSARCKEIFQELVLIAYRKGKNLAQTLSSKRLPLATSHSLAQYTANCNHQEITEFQTLQKQVAKSAVSRL